MTPPAKKKNEAAADAAETPEAPASSSETKVEEAPADAAAKDAPPVKGTVVPGPEVIDVSTSAAETTPDESDGLTAEDLAELAALREAQSAGSAEPELTRTELVSQLNDETADDTGAGEPEPNDEDEDEEPEEVPYAPAGVLHKRGDLSGTVIAWNGKRYPAGEEPKLETIEDLTSALEWAAGTPNPRRYVNEIARAADKLGLKVDVRHILR